MKIAIYSGYNNGLGDLNFGKKLINFVKDVYPDADIQLITSPTDLINKKIDGLKNVVNFNKNNDYPVLPLDKYLEQEQAEADLVLVGPTLNIEASIVQSIAPSTTTPLILMSEYDFSAWQMEDLTQALNEAGYNNINKMPTGLSYKTADANATQGIFINEEAVNFKKNDPNKLDEVFANKLEKTGQVILGQSSPSNYIENTNVAVSYSHNNAERFLTVHSLISQADKNTDIIIMGEEAGVEKKDKPILVRTAQALIGKGFGKIIYQETGKDPEIIAQAENNGPTYRVIHTGQVSPTEATNLRKIGGNFSGATGDQSYSEAIASSSAIIYECQSWKKGFVEGMKQVADTIDDTGNLSRTVHLLSFASNDEEYSELATLLKKDDIQDGLAKYREKIINERNFSKKFHEELSLQSMPFKVVSDDRKNDFIGKLAMLATPKIKSILQKQGLHDLYKIARYLEYKIEVKNAYSHETKKPNNSMDETLLKLVKAEFNQRLVKSKEFSAIKSNAEHYFKSTYPSNKGLGAFVHTAKSINRKLHTFFNSKNTSNYLQIYENHLKYLEAKQDRQVQVLRPNAKS